MESILLAESFPEKILVSGCSAGLPVSWDGNNRLKPAVKRLLDAGAAVAVCPEKLGGLPVPRETCEIIGGDGDDVLDGRARVLTKTGRDVTAEFLAGAEKTLAIARKNRCLRAILKARSPACGSGSIYDGSFSGAIKTGNGVTAALLNRHGINVTTDEEA